MSAQSELLIIATYFTDITPERCDVILGIGDDCALLQCPTDHVVAVSIDTLVEGVHFFKDTDPENLGYKSLAVGLSDLAAMGAKPAWFTLTLTLPKINTSWLEAFSRGMATLAKQYSMQLVGGDTTRGSLSISIQVHGFVKVEYALRRNGAQVGDLIYVSGTLGNAGMALQLKLHRLSCEGLTLSDKHYLVRCLEKPTPRIELSEFLLDYATSAIDISDGLSSDLMHILTNSGVGAIIESEKIPLSSSLQKIPIDEAIELALHSGDDYELCFTIPACKVHEFELAVAEKCTSIGKIKAAPGLLVVSPDGQEQLVIKSGYEHFQINGYI
ncbi:MAG: thiamine-phosphate kinase [Piscirickettsiaceae bacterium]|nr:thiamine-phosphate kinase [Piscirickettsiaceae bacterium]